MIITSQSLARPSAAVSLRPAAEPPQDTYREAGLGETLKNMATVTAFGAGPALAAAHWGWPGAVIGIGAAMLATAALSRDRGIMVPFVGLTSGILSLGGAFFGWPGALVSTAIAAGYGYVTR